MIIEGRMGRMIRDGEGREIRTMEETSGSSGFGFSIKSYIAIITVVSAHVHVLLPSPPAHDTFLDAEIRYPRLLV
jgi:hypothetical protein